MSGIYNQITDALTLDTLDWLNFGFYHVRAYGAVGDGTTDDSAAIRSAITAIPASGGTLVFEPSKTYIVAAESSVLGCLSFASKTNLRIFGFGATLKVKASSIGNYTSSTISLKSCTRVLIDGLTIDGNRANQAAYSEFNHGIAIGDLGDGISTTACTHVQVRNCKIFNTCGDSILISNSSTDIWIDQNNLSDPNNGGLGNARMGIGLVCGSRVWITRNHFAGSGAMVAGRMAIDLESDAASQVIGNTWILDNVMSSTDWNRGVSVVSNGGASVGTITIRGNVFTRYISFAPGSATGAFFICENNLTTESIVVNNCARAVVRGNIVKGVDVDGGFSSGIVISNVNEGGVVDGNLVVNESGAAMTAGAVNVLGTTKGLSIAGNSLRAFDGTSTLTYGIRIASSGGSSPNKIHIGANMVGSASMTSVVDVSSLTETNPATNLITVDPFQGGLDGSPTNFISDQTKVYTRALGIITSAVQPRATVYNSAAQSLANDTITAITFDSETLDVGAMHSTSSNTSRVTVPANGAGLYLIFGSVRYASNATGQRQARLKKNGTTDLALDTLTVVAATSIAAAHARAIVDLAAGDYVELYGYQNSGGALDTGSATRALANELTLVRLW